MGYLASSGLIVGQKMFVWNLCRHFSDRKTRRVSRGSFGGSSPRVFPKILQNQPILTPFSALEPPGLKISGYAPENGDQRGLLHSTFLYGRSTSNQRIEAWCMGQVLYVWHASMDRSFQGDGGIRCNWCFSFIGNKGMHQVLLFRSVKKNVIW